MLRSIKTFFKSEIAIGVSLFFATLAAILVANSENYQVYKDFFNISLPLKITAIGISKNMTLLEWINDFLMAIFFLLVGLELKKEIMIGELSSKKKFILPLIGAFGGVIFPIAIFLIVNFNNPENLRGFAIPAATDIAFAYGIISLFGKKFSSALKVFLVALAIIDDLIAIILIGVFYTKNLDFSYFALGGFAFAGLVALNYFNSKKISLYLILGAFLWLMILKSGVHATLAGVLVALSIPLQVGEKSLVSNLAHKISPTVNFLILPIFAFANAGVQLYGFSMASLLEPLTLGIILGLFFGKQFGVILMSFIAVKLHLAHLPKATTWPEFYIASILAGVGFTMSLFIGSLAFSGNDLAFDQVKIGVIFGSLFSAILAIFIAQTLKKRN